MNISKADAMDAAQKRKPIASKKLTDPDNAAEQELPSHRSAAQRPAAGLSSTTITKAAAQTSSVRAQASKPSQSRPQTSTSQGGTKRSADVAFGEPASATATGSSDAGSSGKGTAHGTPQCHCRISFTQVKQHILGSDSPRAREKTPTAFRDRSRG